ncbi:kinase-like domain-containing protein, partial [Gautieria morchelliformis]
MSAQTKTDNINTWQRLGSGIHSVVWRAKKSGNSSLGVSSQGQKDACPDPLSDLPNWVAVKVVYNNESAPPHDIVREASILKSVSHRNIISMLEFVCHGPNAPYALYMPLIPLPLAVLLDSPLFTTSPITGPYSAFARPVLRSSQQPGAPSPFAVVAKSLIYQLLLAISYLHSLNPPISHRDVNPGNVLIDSDAAVKLVDFGIAWTELQNQGDMLSNTASAQEYSSTYTSRYRRETPQEMCCQVSTGPHRAPELLFSPPSYIAMAIDLWSLGTTIAQFFTPLQLNPFTTPLSSPTLTAADEVDEVICGPFLIPDMLRKNIDYRATWERKTLFDRERGELGLAWSIFRLRGTPNENTWPSFGSLPDASKVEFRDAIAQPLHMALPHLPMSAELAEDESPISLIDKFLAYPPPSRLAASQALQHPWFSTDLLLPASHPGPDGAVHEKRKHWLTKWKDMTLAALLEPALMRQASKVTQPTTDSMTFGYEQNRPYD